MRWRAQENNGSRDQELWMLPTNRVEGIIKYLEVRIKEFEQEEYDDPERFARRLQVNGMLRTATKANTLKYRWIKRLRITKLFMERELFYRSNHYYRGFVVHIRNNPKDQEMCLIFADALETEIPDALGRNMVVMARKFRMMGAGIPCPPWQAGFRARQRNRERGNPSPYITLEPSGEPHA